jgi:NitT/TauT family transport system substrate-binding protein
MSKVRIAVAAVLVLALALAGCSGTSSTEPTKLTKVRIGTLPTEDALPLWVAQKQGLFKKAGLDVSITTFQSAQERDAALTASAIDGFMGDIIAAAELEAGGVPVRITTVMLGATPAEGRFGVAVKPKSTVTQLAQLADKPVGVSSGTIQEYVLDRLMEAAGVGKEHIRKEEVKKVPARFELLMSGKLDAAALPEPFLSLAEKQGARIVADDTKGPANLSQTVLVFSKKFLDKTGGADAVSKLLGVWDEAVGVVNADPNSWRPLLVEKARLPKPLATIYRVNTYPTHLLPTKEQVEDVLGWMRTTGILGKTIFYEDLVWQP